MQIKLNIRVILITFKMGIYNVLPIFWLRKSVRKYFKCLSGVYVLCPITCDVLVMMSQCFVEKLTLSVAASVRNCRPYEFALKCSAVTHELYILWT